MLRIFLAEYGERGRALLRFILEESRSSSGELGDFSFKAIRERFRVMGMEYNPSPLLAKLEKEIGVIETSYRSTTQRWWRIIDREAIEGALGSERELSLRAKVLRAQFYSLKPMEMLEALERAKRSAGEAERSKLRRMAFEELPLLLRVVEEAKASGEEEALAEEIRLAKAIIDMFEEIVAREPSARERLSSTPPRASEALPEKPWREL